MSAPPARLSVLGGFGLADDGRDIVLSMPAQRLLAFLALADHAVPRDLVAETLWIESSHEHAVGSLRSALCKLRKACGRELVDAGSGRLALAESVTVDLHEAVALARSVLDRSTAPSEQAVYELSLAGDILPDWYDDWVALDRERFRQLRVHALETLCAGATAAGRYGEAMEAGLASIRSEPLRESARRAVMRVHLAEGNRAEALAEYRRFRARLQDDLGLSPSARMDELLCQIGMH